MWRAPRLMNSVRSRSLNHDASIVSKGPSDPFQSRSDARSGFFPAAVPCIPSPSAVLYQQMFARWSQFPAFICTGASTVAAESERTKKCEDDFSLSSHVWSVCMPVWGVRKLSWRNKRRVFIYHTCDAPLFLSNRDALMAKVQEEDMCW